MTSNLNPASITSDVVAVARDISPQIFAAREETERQHLRSRIVWPRPAYTKCISAQGQWNFASGIHNANWLFCPSVIMDSEVPRRGPGGIPPKRDAVPIVRDFMLQRPEPIESVARA